MGGPLKKAFIKTAEVQMDVPSMTNWLHAVKFLCFKMCLRTASLWSSREHEMWMLIFRFHERKIIGLENIFAEEERQWVMDGKIEKGVYTLVEDMCVSPHSGSVIPSKSRLSGNVLVLEKKSFLSTPGLFFCATDSSWHLFTFQFTKQPSDWCGFTEESLWWTKLAQELKYDISYKVPARSVTEMDEKSFGNTVAFFPLYCTNPTL